MRILVGCELSGRVRDAFIRNGHDAMSCDREPTEVPGPHYQGDVLDILDDGWDAAIFFPPCTYLTVSGLHRNKGNPIRAGKTVKAIEFVETLWNAPIPFIAIENPVGCLSTRSTLGKPQEIIQPYWFGEDASKTTCLWLKGFPLLKPTRFVVPRMVMDGEVKDIGKFRWSNQTDSGQNNLPPSDDRAKIRSQTYQGVADAIGQQWGSFLHSQAEAVA